MLLTQPLQHRRHGSRGRLDRVGCTDTECIIDFITCIGTGPGEMPLGDMHAAQSSPSTNYLD